MVRSIVLYGNIHHRIPGARHLYFYDKGNRRYYDHQSLEDAGTSRSLDQLEQHVQAGVQHGAE